jgi:hypothetical protein
MNGEQVRSLVTVFELSDAETTKNIRPRFKPGTNSERYHSECSGGGSFDSQPGQQLPEFFEGGGKL